MRASRAGPGPSGNVVITGGTGVNIKLGTCRIPMISAPTGTMANNGAITLGTALDAIYADCYLFLPAGAIAAGVPAAAGWFYAQMSSTTVGVVFNNAYTTGDPTVPTSPTAFVTTGPGAFTGDTSEQGVIFTVPVLNAGARIYAKLYLKNNNSAGAKTPRIRLNGASGAVLNGAAQTTNTDTVYEAFSYNITQAKQRFYGDHILVGSASLEAASVQTATVDMSAATDIRLTLQKAVATDYAIIELGEASFVQ